MTRFYNRIGGLRAKLILAFLVVGLLPLLGAVWVATGTVSQVLRREMISQLQRAAVRVEKYIDSEGNRLALVAYMAASSGALLEEGGEASREEAIRIRKTRRVDFVCLCDGRQVKGDPDVKLLQLDRKFTRGFGIVQVIYRGEEQPALVGVYRMGRWVGVAGKLISISFVEDLEELTGVEVAVYLKNGREWGIPDNLSPRERALLRFWLKKVSSKGVPVYDKKITMGGHLYRSVFIPLKNWQGEPLGMLLLSLSGGGFMEYFRTARRYFLLILGLGVLLSILLGWWVSGRISQPIQRFAQSADGIARGDYSLKVPLTQRRDEIGDLARSFERMRQGLREAQRREKLASLGELSAGLAHEIRNPLGIIKNAAEGLLSRDRSREEQALLLEIIVEEACRLNKLVSDFLDFARPRPPEKVEASLKDLVEEVAFSFEEEARGKGVALKVDAEGLVLPFDRHQMRQVLLNLLFNALDATPPGGEIRVTLRREGEEALLCVEDTGSGIPRDKLDRIFDPFFTTKEGGTGLGLAVVYRVVEAHGGTVQVESGEDGTRFTVRLPLA